MRTPEEIKEAIQTKIRAMDSIMEEEIPDNETPYDIIKFIHRAASTLTDLSSYLDSLTPEEIEANHDILKDMSATIH